MSAGTATPPSATLGPLVAFLTFGAFAGCWAAMFPAFRDHAGAGAGELGVALLLSSLGAAPAMLVTGPLLDRFGPRVVAMTAIALGVATFVTAFAGSVLALVTAFMLVGFTSGAMDIAMNGAVAHVEAGTRPLMNIAHATFSIGAVVGGALTGVARDAGWSSPAITGSLGIVLAASAACNRGGIEAWHGDDVVANAPIPSSKPMFTPFLVVLGCLVALSFVVEATAFSWAAIHVEDTFHASAGTAGLAVAVYFAGSVVGRVAAHLWGARASARALVCGSGLIIAAAAATVAASPGVTLAIVALFALGLGTATVAPTLYSVASASAGTRRGAALATVAMLAYVGNLAGPALAGLVAEAASLRAAFAVTSVVGLVLLAGALVALRRTGAVQLDASVGDVPDTLGAGIHHPD
ncbi:MAG: major facilitator superfamily transporter [Thermoleophilia bacterium]|nr:major facilitator superfamily transporter [Thermoleophilia bacterium]